MRKTNDVILQTAAVVIFFIILMLSVQVFFAGHYSPGGGFIGGLMTSAALVLMLLAYDKKTLKKIIPFNFRRMIGFGLLLSMMTALHSVLFGKPFFTHAYTKVDLPLLGEQTLHTAIPFDLGVYLVVVGVTMTIIQTIGESD